MNDRSVLQTLLQGKPLSGFPVVDCHGHLDLWKGWFAFRTDAESMIATMDRVGIDVLCVNQWNCPDIQRANDDVAAAVKTYPQRFVGFAATGPSFGKQQVRDELKRCFEELGYQGIKVHNGYDVLPLRDQAGLPEFAEAMEAIWRFAADRKCPVLCHGYLTPEIARRYPEAVFIRAHACGERTFAERFRGCPNVFFDTANSLTMRGNIEYILERIGADRILYGSDMPYANPAYRMGQVISAKIDEKDLKNILGGNMARILGLNASKIKKESHG